MNKKFVWIGAGSATSPHFSFDDFDSIVLVEARKEACDELNEHFEDNAKVKTKQVCIADRNGESAFFQCNVEELSALAKPAKLTSLYPGLKVKSYDVDTVSITDFLKEEIVDGGIELFIDIPATSWILVRELSKNKFLDSITKLHVSIGTVPALYEESADLTELASLLKTNCFDEIARDYSDPDIPVVSFKSNESLKAVESLKAENSELQQQLIEARQHNDEIEHKANNLSSDLAVKSDLIEAKDIEIQALNREMAKYKADLQKKSLDCDELCNQLEVSKSSNLEIENKLAEEHAKVAKLTKELEEQATKLKRAEDICDSLKDVERKISEELADSKSRLTELTEEFDAQASKLKITVEALETSKESEQNKSTELKNSQSKLDTLTNELSQLRLKIEERERNFEANENKIAELNAQLLSKNAELDKQSESNSELIAINEKVEKECDKLNEWRLENKKWSENLVEENSLLKVKLNDCEKQVSSLERNVSTLKDIHNASTTKEKNTARTLDLNTKLMSKMQNDLDELRIKYKEKVQAEESLQDLIAELHLKLKQASVFYHSLEARFPEIASATKDFS